MLFRGGLFLGPGYNSRATARGCEKCKVPILSCMDPSSSDSMACSIFWPCGHLPRGWDNP